MKAEASTGSARSAQAFIFDFVVALFHLWPNSECWKVDQSGKSGTMSISAIRLHIFMTTVTASNRRVKKLTRSISKPKDLVKKIFFFFDKPHRTELSHFASICGSSVTNKHNENFLHDNFSFFLSFTLLWHLNQIFMVL